MKQFMLLLLVFCGASAKQYYSLADTFQQVLDTEKALEEDWKTNFENARAAREQYKQQVSQKLNDALSKLSDAVKQKADEVRQQKEQEDQARKEIFDKVSQKWKDFANEVKQFYDQKKEEKEAERQEKQQQIKDWAEQMKTTLQKKKEEKEQKRQEQIEQWEQIAEKLKQKRDEFNQQVEQAKQKVNEEKKQKLEQLRTELKELKDLITAEVQNRLEQKQQRVEDQKKQAADLKNQIVEQQKKLEEDAGKVSEQIGQYKKDENDITKLIQDLLQQGVKNQISEKFNEDLQAKLDKAALKQVLDEKKNVAEAQVADVVASVGPPIAVIAEKATILDEITGKAAWETVTWVLLALCILLSVALIIIIIYQVKQKSVYERLDGHDSSHHPSTPHYRSERDPLLPPPATPTTAPPLVPNKEELQF